MEILLHSKYKNLSSQSSVDNRPTKGVDMDQWVREVVVQQPLLLIMKEVPLSRGKVQVGPQERELTIVISILRVWLQGQQVAPLE